MIYKYTPKKVSCNHVTVYYRMIFSFESTILLQAPYEVLSDPTVDGWNSAITNWSFGIYLPFFGVTGS